MSWASLAGFQEWLQWQDNSTRILPQQQPSWLQCYDNTEAPPKITAQTGEEISPFKSGAAEERCSSHLNNQQEGRRANRESCMHSLHHP